jgi:hypothetical protein
MSQSYKDLIKTALSKEMQTKVRQVPYTSYRAPEHPLESRGAQLSKSEQEEIDSHHRSHLIAGAEEHQDLIETEMRKALEEMRTDSALLITLVVGVGEIESDSNRQAIDDALMDMRRVQEVDDETGEVLLELVPIRIYCFRARGYYEVQVVYPVLNETGPDVTRFLPIQTIESTSNFRNLFDKISAAATFNAAHLNLPERIPYFWKSVTIEEHKSSPRVRGELMSSQSKEAYEEMSRNAPVDVIADLRQAKGDFGRAVSRSRVVLRVRFS